MEHKSKKRRVAITGIGAVTPLGLNLTATWNGILQGVCPAGPIRNFDASTYPCKIAFEVDPTFRLREDLILAREREYLNRAAAFACQAAAEALQQASLVQNASQRQRTAVCLGVGSGDIDFNWHVQVFHRGLVAPTQVKPIASSFPNQLSAIVARMAGAEAGTTTVHTACASSGQALGEAYEMIANHEVDVVISGGADTMIEPFYLAGFSLLGALSTRSGDPKKASRPFDRNRDGFVLGEGACIIVLEAFEHAQKRGAEILAELVGYGVTESAYRVTDLHPLGHGPIEAMRDALSDAGISPRQVGYINAHGTSTPLNDRIEAQAINQVFLETSPLVSSTKSMTGHMIAAAGAIELSFCVLALKNQVLPPSINVDEVDPDCPVKLTQPTSKPASFDYALSNSVGFGGSNTALIAKRVAHAH